MESFKPLCHGRNRTRRITQVVIAHTTMRHVPSLTRYLFILVLLGFLLCLNGCTDRQNYNELALNQYPLFVDDFSQDSLLTAIDHHLNYLHSFPAEKKIHGNHIATYGSLVKSLTLFQEIIMQDPSPYELDEIIRNNFTVYEAGGRKTKEGKILLTGYYEPVFEGSLLPTEKFKHPLYSIPDSLVVVKNRNNGKNTVGRKVNDKKLIPFWTRAEIETKGVIKGYEIVYLKDPLDAYLLHVQGSGRIQLRDGSIRSIGYNGSNGLGYNSLGKLFVDMGLIPLAEVSIPAIRNYFNKHPNKITEMLHHNPRYIFFKWGDNKGARGSLGTILTPGRSVAVDHTIFPSGTFGYLVSKKPVLDQNGTITHWKTFSRFVLPQDSGSAIKGPGRVDLFWGNGEYAEVAASHMKEEGKFFLLIQNSFELPGEIR